MSIHHSRAGWDRRVCRLWTKQSRWTFVKHFSSSLTWHQSWGSPCSGTMTKHELAHDSVLVLRNKSWIFNYEYTVEVHRKLEMKRKWRGMKCWQEWHPLISISSRSNKNIRIIYGYPAVHDLTVKCVGITGISHIGGGCFRGTSTTPKSPVRCAQRWQNTQLPWWSDIPKSSWRMHHQRLRPRHGGIIGAGYGKKMGCKERMRVKASRMNCHKKPRCGWNICYQAGCNCIQDLVMFRLISVVL